MLCLLGLVLWAQCASVEGIQCPWVDRRHDGHAPRRGRRGFDAPGGDRQIEALGAGAAADGCKPWAPMLELRAVGPRVEVQHSYCRQSMGRWYPPEGAGGECALEVRLGSGEIVGRLRDLVVLGTAGWLSAVAYARTAVTAVVSRAFQRGVRLVRVESALEETNCLPRSQPHSSGDAEALHEGSRAHRVAGPGSFGRAGRIWSDCSLDGGCFGIFAGVLSEPCSTFSRLGGVSWQVTWLRGYAGEGPSDYRVPVDLGQQLEAVTANRYASHIARFSDWLWSHERIQWQTFSVMVTVAQAAFLDAYVQVAFNGNLALSHVVDLLAALQLRFPELRGTPLRPAWMKVRRWRVLYPSAVRTPLPQVIWRAMVVLAMAQGWEFTAMILWVAFAGLLRPNEAAMLKRRLLSLGCDLLGLTERGVITIPLPKTRNRGHMIQSVVLADRALLRFLERKVGGLAPEVLLCPGGLPGLRSRFQALLKQLNVPTGLYTLGSLRGGGACSHFLEHGNLAALQFHGRWDSLSSVSHYLQVGLSTASLAQIPPAAISRIRELSSLFAEIFQ